MCIDCYRLITYKDTRLHTCFFFLLPYDLYQSLRKIRAKKRLTDGPICPKIADFEPPKTGPRPHQHCSVLDLVTLERPVIIPKLSFPWHGPREVLSCSQTKTLGVRRHRWGGGTTRPIACWWWKNWWRGSRCLHFVSQQFCCYTCSLPVGTDSKCSTLDLAL